MIDQLNPRSITPRNFALLGLENLAYIKTVIGEGGEVAYAIHSADGSQVTVVDDRETAFATVRQHDLEPLSVH